jgi:hypothetical protein
MTTPKWVYIKSSTQNSSTKSICAFPSSSPNNKEKTTKNLHNNTPNPLPLPSNPVPPHRHPTRPPTLLHIHRLVRIVLHGIRSRRRTHGETLTLPVFRGDEAGENSASRCRRYWRRRENLSAGLHVYVRRGSSPVRHRVDCAFDCTTSAQCRAAEGIVHVCGGLWVVVVSVGRGELLRGKTSGGTAAADGARGLRTGIRGWVEEGGAAFAVRWWGGKVDG